MKSGQPGTEDRDLSFQWLPDPWRLSLGSEHCQQKLASPATRSNVRSSSFREQDRSNEGHRTPSTPAAAEKDEA